MQFVKTDKQMHKTLQCSGKHSTGQEYKDQQVPFLQKVTGSES